MNLSEFLKKDSFKKYNHGIDEIYNDFILKGYEKFLFLGFMEEMEDMSKTSQKITKSLKSTPASKYALDFLNQFIEIDNTDVVYIFPEKYDPNYFIIQEVIKKAKRICILNNLFPNDSTVNYLVVFDNTQINEIILMNHLVYSTVLGDNFGGYKLFGYDILYYAELTGTSDYNYSLPKPNSLTVFQGRGTRRDNNPFLIYYVRENIRKFIDWSLFDDEWQLFVDLNYHILPILQKMYLDTKHIEEADNKQYDWKVEKEIIKSKLVNEGVIQTQWKNEQALFKSISKMYKDTIFQYRPSWLSPQSLDIFIPQLRIGIEYQGIQHYRAVDFFGGDKAFEDRKRLDKQKKEKCLANGVTLMEWNYNVEINDDNITHFCNSVK